MGNLIKHYVITIELDIWEPFKKESEVDLDKLVERIKTKELLTHCGNVHMHYREQEKQGDK